MMKTRRYVFAFYFFAVASWLAQDAFSQTLPKEVSFERVTIPGTIRSSQVTNILQDSLGLLWLSGHGLYRYDGFKFKQYSGLSDSVIFNPQDILALHYDAEKNRVLVGTRRFGILEYNYNTDKLVVLPSENKAPIVNQLAQTSDKKVWAASYNSGLFFLENDTLKKLPDPKKKFVHPATILSSGTALFVGEIGRVIALENGKITIEIKLNSEPFNTPAYTVATTLCIDKNQKLWIGTEKQGVLVYDLKSEKFVQHFPANVPPFYSKISRIYEDREGLIWILTKASGLAVYSPSEDKLLYLTRDAFSSKSLSSDNCFSIVEDKQGIIWIGATGDINKFDRDQIKFKHIFHNPLERLSLTDNMVRGVLEDKDGNILVGTDGGYINILNLENHTTRQIKVRVKNDPTNYVPLYLHDLNSDVILVGTSMGLLQLNKKTFEFDPFQPLWDKTQKRIIRQLLTRGDSLCFLMAGSVVFHDLKTGKTAGVKYAGDRKAYNITTIYLDHKNRLWAGSNKGVSLFNDQTKQFRYIEFKNLPPNADGSLLLVLSIEEIDNKLYVGTFNQGLWVLDITDINNIPPARCFIDQVGLTSNTIYSSIPDNNGMIWLSTNSGLVRFDPASNQFVSFSISEGLQEEEFNRLASAKTRSGSIVLGGINGLNIFNPADISVERENFETRILSVTANDPISAKPEVQRVTDFSQPLKFTYNQNSISIHFFIAHYKQPKRFSLFYRFENVEKEWKEVLNENVASYSNLQPGSYTFKLKTVGLNGQEKIMSLPITISKPFWQTWWFVLLAVCAISLMVITIIRSYFRKNQFDRQRLESLLKLRTSEIEKSKEDLQILNQKKDLIFSILSHDLRSPLTTLKGFLGYIIDNAHELAVEDLKKHAISIRTSVTNSLDLIDNTLFWSLSQMGNIQYTPSNFSLRQLIDKLQGLYQLTADKKRIPLSILCDDDIIIHGDENMVYVTLRNLVSNALKFTTEGNPVKITCYKKFDYAEINVVDAGIGMSEEYLQKILSMDQPMLKKGTSNEKGTGLGLLLCKKFIELNKGELLISSVENKGTTFTVILPLEVNEPSTVEAD
jgi:signal transduction histidine kinase/ligand-binding sensor domain-containing protein